MVALEPDAGVVAKLEEPKVATSSSAVAAERALFRNGSAFMSSSSSLSDEDGVVCCCWSGLRFIASIIKNIGDVAVPQIPTRESRVERRNPGAWLTLKPTDAAGPEPTGPVSVRGQRRGRLPTLRVTSR